MSSQNPEQKFANSNAGFNRLTHAWGKSVPKSLRNTSQALIGLQRFTRRHS